jgi:hypothetical protein
MFKPNVTPLLLDQMKSHVPIVITLKSGERVIEDPEHSTERVMLWFYLLINIGAFMSTATSYCKRRWVVVGVLAASSALHSSAIHAHVAQAASCSAQARWIRLAKLFQSDWTWSLKRWHLPYWPRWVVGRCETVRYRSQRTQARDSLQRRICRGRQENDASDWHVLLLPGAILERQRVSLFTLLASHNNMLTSCATESEARPTS